MFIFAGRVRSVGPLTLRRIVFVRQLVRVRLGRARSGSGRCLGLAPGAGRGRAGQSQVGPAGFEPAARSGRAVPGRAGRDRAEPGRAPDFISQ